MERRTTTGVGQGSRADLPPLDAAVSYGRTVRLEGAPTTSSLAHLAALGVIRGLRCAPLWLHTALILESLA